MWGYLKSRSKERARERQVKEREHRKARREAARRDYHRAAKPLPALTNPDNLE